jgi:flavin reductase (DIM6/NTAB) family NADH-FMN oxidoreductase RutF
VGRSSSGLWIVCAAQRSHSLTSTAHDRHDGSVLARSHAKGYVPETLLRRRTQMYTHAPRKEDHMQRVSISQQAFPYPMPMSIVSTVVDGKVNHMAVGWITRTNFQPPMIGVALNKSHHTNRGIREHRAFAVSIPSVDLVRAVDFTGLVSGANVDKSELFKVFYGAVEHAPMVAECPLAMACRLAQTVDQPTNEFFIGEIVEAYCAEQFMTGGSPDVEKINPITLTMPDNRFWAVGSRVAEAWSVGKGYR